MEYNIYLIHSRNDSKFIRNLAKAFAAHRLSAFYSSPLERQDRLSESIRKGFASATYGIIVVSPAFTSLNITKEDKQYLSEIVNLKQQFLHQIWHNIDVDEIARFDPRLVDRPTIFSPPETAESIARKFVVKVAGERNLQATVLDQCHHLMRYKPPSLGYYTSNHQTKAGTRLTDILLTSYSFLGLVNSDLDSTISVFRVNPIRFLSSIIINVIQHYLVILPRGGLVDASNETNLMLTCKTDSAISRTAASEKLDKNEDDFEEEKHVPGLDEIFSSENIQTYFSRMLDVNLRGLSNWKDLSSEIGLHDADVNAMIHADSPTMCLIKYLLNTQLNVRDLENACVKINRPDIKVFLHKLY